VLLLLLFDFQMQTRLRSVFNEAGGWTPCVALIETHQYQAQ
jgi:hypothetical protein